MERKFDQAALDGDEATGSMRAVLPVVDTPMAKNKRKNRKRRGHDCWCCQSILPNEKFSGTGHARHLCKACQKLPSEEREFRSARNILARCVTWEGIIPKKKWRQFLAFLEHPNPTIREFAAEMQQEDAEQRRGG